MTLNYQVWMRSDERLWWVDVRIFLVLLLAKLLGIYVSDEGGGGIES